MCSKPVQACQRRDAFSPVLSAGRTPGEGFRRSRSVRVLRHGGSPAALLSLAFLPVALLAPAVSGCRPGDGSAERARVRPVAGTASDGRHADLAPAKPRHLSLTLYGGGAFVRDRRKTGLRKGGEQGTAEVEFANVPALLDPYSARLAPRDGQPLTVLEQNYDYDLYSSGILLDRAVGQRVKAVFPDGREVVGELLSFDYGRTDHAEADYHWDLLDMERNSEALLRRFGKRPDASGFRWQVEEYWCRVAILTGGGAIRQIYVNDLADLRLAESPPGMSERPRLRWLLEDAGGSERELELSYICDGLKWKVEYLLRLDPSEDTCELDARLQITNRTGTDFEGAEVRLVAGDVRIFPETVSPRIVSIPLRRERKRVFICVGWPSTGYFGGGGDSGRQLFEYYLYVLPKPLTIRDGETKRMELLQPVRNVPVKTRKLLRVYWDDREYEATLEGEIVNSSEYGLGFPLPAGFVSVWKTHAGSGDAEPAWSEHIGNVPPGEKFRVDLTRIPTLTCNRSKAAMVRADEGTVVLRWSCELKNASDRAENVEIKWHGPWSGPAPLSLSITPSLPAERTGERTLLINANVPARGSTVFHVEMAFPNVGGKRS